ncbi:MAG: hypothetical protein KIS92_18335 [Planctomycetota bacterium]|nr:hypothetical protein [Planctomycetota bacterium]
MIFQEFAMFQSAAKVLRIMRHPEDPRREKFFEVLNERYAESLFLESFLLHARNLADFLFLKAPSETDDVVAEHYFDNDAFWKRRDLAPGNYLADHKLRLYQVLSRPRFDRARYGTLRIRKWNVKDIEIIILEAWNEFWGSLDDEKRSWFEA